MLRSKSCEEVKMIYYNKSYIKEEEVEFVLTEGKDMTLEQIGFALKITKSKVGVIRKYIRYEIYKEEPFFKTDVSNKKEYRKIPSLLFLYEISAGGTLRNVKSKRILRGTTDESGYLTISFMNRSITKHYGTHHKKRIHQLVMEAWGPPKPFPEAVIDHIDRNKNNNNISNLRWCRVLDNRRNSVLWDGKPERQYKEVIVDGKHFESLADAARYIKTDPNVIITHKNIMDRMYNRRTHILGHNIKYII